MVKQVKPLRITHIDEGAYMFHPSDMDANVPTVTGAWPKVSFSDGNTFSYMWLTNSKVILFTANAKKAISDDNYNFLMNEFFNSKRPFKTSNWLVQQSQEWPVDTDYEPTVASVTA